MYYMLLYKLKVMHVEYDILNLFHITQNRNEYPREEIKLVMTPLWFL